MPNQNIEFIWFTTVTNGQLGVHPDNLEISPEWKDIVSVTILSENTVHKIPLNKNADALNLLDIYRHNRVKNADH